MVTVPPRERLVGRDREITRLEDVMTALAAGRGTVVEIAGDPGIGKTSLLGVLTALAGRADVRVARAHALRDARQHAPGRRVPYQVFRDAWGDRPGMEAAGDGVLGDDRFSGTVDAHPRFRMGRAVRTLLAEWAAGGGGVLILDDVQWCDEESEALAAQLVRTPVPGPFVLALAHRPRQTRPLLLEALDHGAQTGTVVRLQPGPLAPDAVASVLDGLRKAGGAPAVPGPDQGSPGLSPYQRLDARHYAEQLHEACAGNPRYLRILAAAGWQPESWPARAGTDRDALLREAATLTAELDELADGTRMTLGAAAVLGDPFRPEDVAVVSGLGLDRTLDALAELTRGDLVRPLASGGRFAFRHGVLGHVAHERAVPSFLLPAHRRALGLLSARGASAAARARHAEHVVGTDGSA
ncbi:AAA family ATPase, partial [Nonomuraea lactucae]|uniref:AAA family ATPase n=1 Tax=Nonomuraea lactucae TaxID=2249762 RepID=UPI0013B43C7B